MIYRLLCLNYSVIIPCDGFMAISETLTGEPSWTPILPFALFGVHLKSLLFLFVCFFRFSVRLVFFKRDAMVFRKLGEGYSYYFNRSLQRFISKFCRPLFLSGRTPVNNKMLHDQIESHTLKEMFTVLFKSIAVLVATDRGQLNFKWNNSWI